MCIRDSGITVHPRTDERHITLQDVYDISKVVKTDYNIEGYPDARFLNIISDIKPEQVTLVPDAPDVITSNRGWKESDLNMDIKSIILSIKRLGSKVSLFIEPSISMINFALDYDVDRIELYTGDYARLYGDNENKIIDKYISVSEYAQKNGIEVNAGHDLDLENLMFFKKSIPNLYEVSIGHALVCDSLIYGLEKTIKRYLEQLK